MIINSNLGSSTAARILGNSTSELQKSLRRLSTGQRIASIADDTAGTAVGTKFSAEIRRISASSDNLANMMSLSQTQDSYLEQISSALDRMSELAMLASDETKNSSDIALYEKELDTLQSFVTAVKGKSFNSNTLFSGASYAVQTGLSDSITLNQTSLTTASSNLLDVVSASAVSFGNNQSSAISSLATINGAINELNAVRANVGANLARLQSEKNALSVLRDNLSAARSRIVDVDVAEESANFAKQQILVQSGTAMLAQANILPQSALRLIS